jgi:hypothetical protein
MGNKQASNNNKQGNKFEKMGISSTSTIDSKTLEIIWKFYAEKGSVLPRDRAMRCLREIGEAVGVDYDEQKTTKLLLSINPSGSFTREQFEGMNIVIFRLSLINSSIRFILFKCL